MASEDALGGSSGVLASEDSSASEPGEAGLLSTCSSGVAGTDESGESDIVGEVEGNNTQVRLQRFLRAGLPRGLRHAAAGESRDRSTGCGYVFVPQPFGLKEPGFGRGAERFKIGNARVNFGSLDRMSQQWRRRGSPGRGEAEILGSAAEGGKREP